MNFQTLEQVFSADYYLNNALNKTKYVQVKTSRSRDKEGKKAILEREKLKTIKDILTKKLSKIIKNYPSLDGLPEFYYELSKTEFDVDTTKKALSNINWTSGKIHELFRTYEEKIRKNNSQVLFLKKQFIGRISSLMKKIDKDLSLLEKTRRKLQTFPDIKENTFTVCLVGFPNVGKSTLLSKITTANPKIANYAFTTKTLNLGYYMHRYERVQVIDSPGTLARFEKMNDIERQAYLATKYVANVLVFVYDLTGTYTIEDQDKLLQIVKDMRKPIIYYISKTDITEKQELESFIKQKKLDFITEPEELTKKINEQKKKY